MSSETLNKRQRQNASQRDAKKAEKAAAEVDRLARLEQHRKTQERERITEMYSGKKGKGLSGGMTASVENGSMVWE